MKKVRMYFFVAICSLFTFNISAQIYGGAQLNYNAYLGGTGIKYVGFGIHGDKATGNDLARLSLNFGLPYKESATHTIYNLSDGEFADIIGGTNKYSFTNFALDFKKFIGGDYEDGGFFLMVGAGLTVATIKYELDSYNTSLYTTEYDYSNPKDRLYQPIIRAGLGYDISFDFGNLFAEGLFVIPANSVGNVPVSINVPFSYGFNTGIRIPLN